MQSIWRRNLAPWETFHAFCRLSILFKINLFENFYQEYHLGGINHIASRSDPTFCQAWSGFALFAKVISRFRLYLIFTVTVKLRRQLQLLQARIQHNVHVCVQRRFKSSMSIHTVWSESSFLRLKKCSTLAIYRATNSNSDRIVQMHRLV